MDIVTVILTALTGIIISLLLKQNGREFAVISSITICVIILAAGVRLFEPAVAFVKTLTQNTVNGGKYIGCVIKCVGICCLASFAQDICIDNNERAIASSVEFAARAAVAVTVLPILKELAETAFKVS